MRAMRKSESYEAVMIDLFLIGALEKGVVEKLIGAQIPEHLVSPIGKDVENTEVKVEDNE